ncbi:MAG: nucleotidyl transferase AbiEii/AbiGii toxin family protein [Acidimicrobiales bacterium]
MIPQANIVEWSNKVPWPTIEQVEQDLLLSRLIVEIAEDPYLSKELAFRGGTCLHKLHIVPGLRYSEDLDYVRRTADGIGDVFDALRAIGDRLGMDGHTARGAHPKVYLRAPFESGSGTMRIKIEVNTHERSPARELIRHPFTVKSAWYEGAADVLTFSREELVATKLRALYQRLKGRDLFDLWLALDRLRLDPSEIVASFAPYRPETYSAVLAERNLREKLGRPAFRDDLTPLVRAIPKDYDMMMAGELVIAELFSKLDG